MIVIYVHNPHDNLVSVTKKELLKGHWTPEGQSDLIAEAKADKKAAPVLPDMTNIEVVFVDFEDVRGILPISQVPCVFLLCEETSNNFPIANIDKIVKATKQANLEKGQQRQRG